MFSCGDHIIRWKEQGIDVTVCTVFSNFKTKKVSKDVRSYVDKSALNFLGIKLLNFGFSVYRLNLFMIKKSILFIEFLEVTATYEELYLKTQ